MEVHYLPSEHHRRWAVRCADHPLVNLTEWRFMPRVAALFLLKSYGMTPTERDFVLRIARKYPSRRIDLETV